MMALEPASVKHYFEALCGIPRSTGNEVGVQKYLLSFAVENEFAVRKDEAGNIVIYVPGRGGGIASATVCLQTHMDMVCAKDEGVEHDFIRDPIRTEIKQWQEPEGEKTVLKAIGTTLGADNGLGLASALAVATDCAVTDCPPLELLFTVSEESGLIGASKLDETMLHSDLLLNLDTEELGSIYISAAGGRDMYATWTFNRTARPAHLYPMRASLQGLPGGHSGLDIHEERGNAIKILLEAVRRAAGDGELLLASFKGGTARNTIASDAEIVFWVSPKQQEALEQQLNTPKWLATLRSNEKITGGITVIAPEEECFAPLSAALSVAILSAVAEIPHGVLDWSKAVEGLVETSNNVATITTSKNQIELCCNTRSSAVGAIEKFQSDQESKLTRAGASVFYRKGYPPWPAEPNSVLLKTAQETFTRVLGHEPKIAAIHAGLECAVLMDKLPQLQIISFGPDIREAHTPRERIHLDSVQPFYNCLTSLLAALTPGKIA